MMASESDIHLYTTQTPNGIKISITLEELGLVLSSPGFGEDTALRITCAYTL